MYRHIPWWVPQITDLGYRLIKDVLDSNFINDGEVTTRFENEIARRVNAKHAVAVTSGTSAIFLALAGFGIGHGDEVIVPDVTFIATANAVTMTGAQPILVDIAPLSLNISADSVRSAITSRTRAIVPVHVSGRAADMKTLNSIAKQHNLVVIEDAAEAFMSSVNGKFLGTISNAGCLSFSPNKTISCGQGGMILTNDDALYSRLRELKDQGRPARGTGGDDTHVSVGYNFKLTNLQSAIGLSQLSVLDERIYRQKRIFSIYRDELCGAEGIVFPGFDLSGGEVPQWTDAIIERRNELDKYLSDMGIDCRRFWHPIHTQAPYFQSNRLFPNSTKLIPHAIWLPSAFTLTDEDILFVCKTIRNFLVNNVGK